MDQLLFTIFLSILLAAIGYWYTVKYSSKYHVKKGGVQIEKYQILGKITHETKSSFIHSARIVLSKGSLDNSMGFMDISITDNQNSIYVDRYAFVNTYTHILISPGKDILNTKSEWTEDVNSHGFNILIKNKKIHPDPINLIPEKVKKYVNEVVTVYSTFEFSKTYCGYRYKSRTTIFAKGIGIVFCKVVHEDEREDIYILEDFNKKSKETDRWLPINDSNNFWKYNIKCQSEINTQSQHIICE